MLLFSYRGGVQMRHFFSFILLPFEFLFDLIIDAWLTLLQLIIPEKYFGKIFAFILQLLIGILSCILLVILIIGLLAAAFTEATVFDLWKLIFIPLDILFLQVILGITIRITTKNK